MLYWRNYRGHQNFIYKTGVRTFEAASYLRRAGANPVLVRQLFQDDLETFVARAEVVKNAEIVLPGLPCRAIVLQGIKNSSLVPRKPTAFLQ